MHYLKQVQIGIDYIETNLDFDITLSQVAKEAGLSQWHFQRIFKALTNETLKTYIRSRRLANSLDKLLTTNLKIIDIAVSAGYESQESFTRAFKATFNLTPNEYRKMGNKSLFLKKIEFDAEYLRHINQNISLTPEVYTQKIMHLVGLQTRFYGVDSEKNNIGEKLPDLWAGFLERISEIQNAVTGICYGVVRQIKDNTDELKYYAAIEVREIEFLPENMVSIDIPPSNYAKFTHRGDVKHTDNTVNYIYSSWLLNSGKRHTSGPDLEIYGPEYVPASEKSVMHYAIPIR
ncbi:MAG: helix-turn-helix domain-containing protein [Gammaproteobacteria bacterium]|nr:helix-turn-helix domain-containing protein [Gammaproteobacteria bacterium]